MIIETRVIKEYHKNGQLMYESTLGLVEPMFAPAYKNMIRNNKGEVLVRIGTTTRFWDNGQVNWKLQYNSDGSLSSDKPSQFRKDGSLIVY